MNKFLELLTSRRFVMIALAAIIVVASDWEVSFQEALMGLAAIFGAAAGVGTIDKAFANFKK